MKFLGRACWNRTKIEEWTRKVRVVGVVDGMNRTAERLVIHSTVRLSTRGRKVIHRR